MTEPDDELARATAPRTSTRTRRAATCRRCPDGTIVKVNQTFVPGPGCARDELRRRAALPGPAHARRPDLPRDPLRAAAADAGRGAGDRASRSCAPTARGCRRWSTPCCAATTPGRPQLVRTTVFDATDRRRYERELLRGAPPRAGDRPAAAAQPAVGSAAGRAGARARRRLPPGRQRARGRRRLVRRVLARRGRDGRAGRRRRRRPRDRGGGDDGPAAQRGPRARGDRLGPGPLLEALDRYRPPRGRPDDDPRLRQLDLGSRRLRYACAGHLPPLIVGPGEAPSFAWDGRSRRSTSSARRGPRARGGAARSRRQHGPALHRRPGRAPLAVARRRDGPAARRGRAHRDEAPATLAAALVRALHDPAARRRRVRPRGARVLELAGARGMDLDR